MPHRQENARPCAPACSLDRLSSSSIPAPDCPPGAVKCNDYLQLYFINPEVTSMIDTFARRKLAESLAA